MWHDLQLQHSEAASLLLADGFTQAWDNVVQDAFFFSHGGFMHQREPIPRGMGDVSSAVDNGKWVMACMAIRKCVRIPEGRSKISKISKYYHVVSVKL